MSGGIEPWAALPAFARVMARRGRKTVKPVALVTSQMRGALARLAA